MTEKKIKIKLIENNLSETPNLEKAKVGRPRLGDKCKIFTKEYFTDRYRERKEGTRRKCECGGTYDHSTKSRHLKTKHHVKFTINKSLEI